MKIYVTRLIPQEIKQLFFDEGHEVTEWTERRPMEPQELINKCKGQDALYVIGEKLDENFFKESSHLKVVATNSVGYDHIHLEAATRFKIPVGNTPGVLSKATADIAFLLMQMVARKAFFWHKEILKGNWGFAQPLENVGYDLQGKTLGVFGLGRIGLELAKSASGAFQMPIIYHNRSRNEEAEKEVGAEYVSFDELLERSDVISVHANLTDENKGMFDKDAFKKMKDSAIFINTARGGLHNEADLFKALMEGLIWGVGLDVTDPEPMDADNPLLNMPTVAILPHIGSATLETRMAMGKLSVENIIAGLKGEKVPNCVNTEVYT